MDSNVVEIERSLYTIWDYFGDIGGFNDFIRIVGSMIMSILTTVKGSGLDKFLIRQLFYRERTKKNSKVRRAPANFAFSLCLSK